MASPVLRLAPHVATQSVEDVLYVARLPMGPIVELDAIGELIWAQLTGRTRDELTARVAAHVGVPIALIAADVESFLEELIELGLILEAH